MGRSIWSCWSRGATGATGAAGAAATGYGQVPIIYTEPPTTHTLNKGW